MKDAIPVWCEAAGDGYMAAFAPSDAGVAARAADLSSILTRCQNVQRIVEVGSGPGANLLALRSLGYEVIGVEPNMIACERTGALPGRAESIPLPDRSADLVLTCGVLIHISPETRATAIHELARVSRRYLLLVEYGAYHPTEAQSGDGVWLCQRVFGDDVVNTGHWTPIDAGYFWEVLHPRGLGAATWWLLERPEQ